MQNDMTGTEQERIHDEIAKLMAETAKLNAEARKFGRETFWYPVAIASGMVGGVAAITAIIIRMFY